MYGWIVDGISSLFEPISGHNPTEWPGKGREIPTRAAEAQRLSHVRPAKRNYQSVYVADNVCQSEQVEAKRRRRDVIISFVKKTVSGVACLLRLRNPLANNCEKHRSSEETQNGPVTLMGIDELHTSWTNISDWKMDKSAGLNDRERDGSNLFRSSSPSLIRKFSGASLPTANPEKVKDWDKRHRSSLQLLPSRPAMGLASGSASTNPDHSCGGLGHSRCIKPCLTVEKVIKENDKEHYRRLLEMVTEKYSKSQPLPFNQSKPQDVSFPLSEHKTAAPGRMYEPIPKKSGAITANHNMFIWRDGTTTKQAKNRRGDLGLGTLDGTSDELQNRRYPLQKQAADLDLSTEVATRLRLVDRDKSPPALSESASHTRICDDELPRLSKDMAAEVSHALGQRDPHLVLSAAFKLRITQRDLTTLQDGGWLNDEVINFYLSLVMERSSGPSDGLKVYSFSTFFFPKLQGGVGQPAGHAAVKRWTKAVDLFLFDVVLVPLHLGVHWALAVIDFRSRSVKSYDSMGQRHDDICSLLLLYLKEEHRAKKGRDLDSSKWTVGSTRIMEIPQQKNGSDCGVFTCKYADYISRGRPLNFRQCHMPLFRKLMIWEILNQKLL